MTATVINGTFYGGGLLWTAVVGGSYKGYTIFGVSNNYPTQTFLSYNIGGSFASEYSCPAGQFPVTVNPNQSVIIEVDFAPLGLGQRWGTGVNFTNLTLVNSGGPNPAQVLPALLFGTGVSAGNGLAQAYPDGTFPNTKLGQVTGLTPVVIVNNNSVAATVTALGLTIGTDFSLAGAPIVPFTIPVGGASAAFTINFAPTVVGSRGDTLSVTTAVGTSTIGLTGYGTTLQSAFNLTGALQGTLMAFPGNNSPVILQVIAGNGNSESSGLFTRLHDFAMPNQEKQLMRIRGHYEDLGPATITFTARSRRVNQPDEIISVSIPIGTAFADGWVREFTSEPTPINGELIQLTGSRAANSGPVSLIDYMPVFEPKGEVIGGT